jgi:hypothetical protein
VAAWEFQPHSIKVLERDGARVAIVGRYKDGRAVLAEGDRPHALSERLAAAGLESRETPKEEEESGAPGGPRWSSAFP